MREGSGRGSGRKVRVLDAAALILGFTERGEEELLTCREVLEEARYGGATPLRAVAAVEKAGVKVVEPAQMYVERVKEAAEEVGEHELSDADLKLLALALELMEEGAEASLATSDYSVQNLASILGLRVEPLLHKGISKEIRWEVYCPVCGWSDGGRAGERCPRCGARLKRRPRA